MLSEALQYTALWFLSFNLLGNAMSLFDARIAARLTAISSDGRDLRGALKRQREHERKELVALEPDDADARRAQELLRRMHADNVSAMQKANDSMQSARTAAWNRTGLLMRTIASAGGLVGGLIAYYG